MKALLAILHSLLESRRMQRDRARFTDGYDYAMRRIFSEHWGERELMMQVNYDFSARTAFDDGIEAACRDVFHPMAPDAFGGALARSERKNRHATH